MGVLQGRGILMIRQVTTSRKRRRMTTARRMMVLSVLGCLSAAAASSTALAVEYPARPIRMIVPFTAGGGADIIARALGQHFGSAFGQNLVVDNRAGGNTVIGSEIVAKS